MSQVPSREEAIATFKQIAGSDGKISHDELRNWLGGCGYNVDQIMKDVDKDGDNFISQKEFLDEVLKKPRLQALSEFFDMMDTDKSGELSRQEIIKQLNKSERGRKVLSNPEKVKSEFAKLDADGDGSITREEFIQFMDAHY